MAALPIFDIDATPVHQQVELAGDTMVNDGMTHLEVINGSAATVWVYVFEVEPCSMGDHHALRPMTREVLVGETVTFPLLSRVAFNEQDAGTVSIAYYDDDLPDGVALGDVSGIDACGRRDG